MLRLDGQPLRCGGGPGLIRLYLCRLILLRLRRLFLFRLRGLVRLCLCRLILLRIRRLFRLFDRSWMLLIPAAVMGVIAIRTRDRKGFILGLVLTALAVGAMAVYIALDFEGAFIAMHRLLFTNDLWLLDPRTDLLICLMPEEMFISLAVRLGLYVIPAWAAAAGCLGWAVCHERIQRFTGDRPGS